MKKLKETFSSLTVTNTKLYKLLFPFLILLYEYLNNQVQKVSLHNRTRLWTLNLQNKAKKKEKKAFSYQMIFLFDVVVVVFVREDFSRDQDLMKSVVEKNYSNNDDFD